MSPMFFFGVLSRSRGGHFWYDEKLVSLWHGHPLGTSSGPHGCPWRDRSAGGIGLDGTMAPRSRAPTSADSIGSTRGHSARTYEVEQGLSTHRVHDGWTLISFWDRSADTRGACNANFVTHDVVRDFEEMRSRSQTVFPTIWSRFPFPVRLHHFDET